MFKWSMVTIGMLVMLLAFTGAAQAAAVNSGTWSVVPSVNPPGDDTLFAVAEISTNNSKGISHQHTSAEHINSQAQALVIKRSEVRNGHSVKNLNTLMSLVINARVLAKAQFIHRRLL